MKATPGTALVIASPAPSRLKRHIGFALILLSVIACAQISDVQLALLFDKAGAQSAWDIFGAFAHPDLSSEFLWRVAGLSLESLLIGILATSIAVAAGFVLALIAIKGAFRHRLSGCICR